jgi:hypothetical protein
MSQADQLGYNAEKVVDLEAELDLSRVQYLTREDNRALQEGALTYPDFTYRHHWDIRGWTRLHLRGELIRKTTNVFASISEADPIVSSQDPVPAPFLGSAVMTVANIAPYNGGVWILVSVNWNTPLWTAVSYLFVNP